MKTVPRTTALPRVLVAALLLAGLWTGCDSSEEDRTDAERLLGTWNAASVDTSGGVELLSLIGGLRAQFLSSTTYRLVATGDGATLLDVSGTFAVDEAGGRITFSSSELARPVSMAYRFEDTSALVLTFPGSALATLGLALEPAVLNSIAGQEVTAILQR